MTGEKDSGAAVYQRVLTTVVFMLVSPAALLAQPINSGEKVHREINVSYESHVLATRGDERVTHAEFDARMQAIPQSDRAGVLANPGRIGKLLNEMLETRTIAQDAIDRGVLENPLVKAELYRAMSVRLAEIQRTHVVESAELTDYTTRAHELYLSDPGRYETEPTVTFTHLLIEDAGDNDAETRIRELLQRVEDGDSLETLVLEYSDDPSATRNGGRFEEAPLDRLDSKFRAGIEELAEGQTDIIASSYGWHLVRLDKRTPSRQKSFEEVADSLRKRARQQHLTRVWENYLREVHGPELVIAPGGVAAILERYGVKPAQNAEGRRSQMP